MAQTHFTFPLRGTWYAGNGPTFYTAHRWALPEEFGFDLTVRHIVEMAQDSATTMLTASLCWQPQVDA